jgi:general secretion pathway protein M
MEKLLSSLSQFNRREQMMILAGGVLVAVYILWLALLAPLQNKRDTLLKTTTATEQSLGRVQILARQFEALAQQSNQANEGSDISGLIDASLRDNGVTMTSFTPGAGGEVRVRVDKITAEVVMQWLYDLETKHHLGVREFSITSSNDPGLVAINVRLIKL